MLSENATAHLVTQAQAGEAHAFEALVRAYLRAAYSVALSVVGRPADAEDVAQNALLLAFERLDSCREPARFGGWLLQIVRNQARNWLTQRALRDVPAEIIQESPREAGIQPDSHGDRSPLLRALRTLTPVRQEVLLLHDLEGWTHAEIASCLEISEVMSRQHLFQARQELRTLLGDRSHQEG